MRRRMNERVGGRMCTRAGDPIRCAAFEAATAMDSRGYEERPDGALAVHSGPRGSLVVGFKWIRIETCTDGTRVQKGRRRTDGHAMGRAGLSGRKKTKGRGCKKSIQTARAHFSTHGNMHHRHMLDI